MVQALDAERFHLAPPLNQIRVGGHSAEDKWFLPLLHLLNAGYTGSASLSWDFNDTALNIPPNDYHRLRNRPGQVLGTAQSTPYRGLQHVMGWSITRHA